MPTQPNVVILFADQLRADALGCYGNTIVSTPALDRLAETGTRFDSAYTPTPVCVPARSALITGWEPQHGDCVDNNMPMSDASTFMDELADAGYRTHGVGKMHFMPDLTALRGFQTREISEENDQFEIDDYLQHVSASGFEFVERPHGLRDEMYYVPQLSPVPEQLHNTRWVADRSIDFLDTQTEGRPFLLWSSFIAPHPPFAPPAPWHRSYEPSTMPDALVPPGSDSLLTIFDRLQSRYKYRDGGTDRRLEQLRKAYYFASVSYLDAQIARIVQALDARGLRENTVILLTADHGEFLGDYGTYGKRSFLDVSARVPLIASGPGFSVGRVRREPVSLVDVRPTLHALAGVNGEHRDGHSLLDPVADRVVYGQFLERELGLYAVITPEWKYIWSAYDAKEFLIDRIRDPRETMNVAYNPRRREDLLDLRARAVDHFDDLADLDLGVESSNGNLPLGERPSPRLLAALRALDIDAEASTLVTDPRVWSPPLNP